MERKFLMKTFDDYFLETFSVEAERRPNMTTFDVRLKML